jgi:hypothetical protein
MGATVTGNLAYDAAISALEGAHQSAISAAGGSQAAVTAADVAYLNGCIAAATTFGIGLGNFQEALTELGQLPINMQN